MSNQHKQPEPDSDCVFCCEPLDNNNYVEYRASDNSPWLPSVYCQTCIVEQFINKQWQTYIDNINKADCAAALKRVISNPPPGRVKDKGLPCDNSTGEVYDFWFNSDNNIHGSELAGALKGEERMKFWKEKTDYMHALELAEQQEKENK